MEEFENENFAIFRDCLSATLLETRNTKSEPKRRRRSKANVVNKSAQLSSQQEAEELADFIDYLAHEIFENLPDDLQEIDHRSWRDSQSLQDQFSLPLTVDSLETLNLPLSISETLRTYSLISPDPTASSPLPATAEGFILPALSAYLSTLTAAPPATRETRADECEICGRSWIPLSYHHLIPRFVHDKAVRRGWHKKEDLQNVAWLCGACHRFVHKFRNHEELARDYYTVELLLAEEEVRQWANWAAKLRWKGGGVRRR
ncbi:HNH endonuclease [Cordyceps fumosorosea ARSEF 2679]|uniref:HNH endonuclease n=1 Tax=Cordyceps fumosorosea (strain ARSEF 2679) TaxID=1081104 RepID=A0A168CP41_CORFA|nr:HNH endonuclease [Cordyceps fumosorosea ARSEF 2679]OAA71616.1 HNH endonuclease [Cordyceps fumosorosea ARSEF 2679]